MKISFSTKGDVKDDAKDVERKKERNVIKEVVGSPVVSWSLFVSSKFKFNSRF